MIEWASKKITKSPFKLEKTQEFFSGLSVRWNDLQPKRDFDVKISEDFHLGFVFGTLESDFVG